MGNLACFVRRRLLFVTFHGMWRGAAWADRGCRLENKSVKRPLAHGPGQRLEKHNHTVVRPDIPRLPATFSSQCRRLCSCVVSSGPGDGKHSATAASYTARKTPLPALQQGDVRNRRCANADGGNLRLLQDSPGRVRTPPPSTN